MPTRICSPGATRHSSVDRRFLDQCEQEVLHLSGAIQPHGALVVTDGRLRVTHLSANHADYLPAELGLHVGASLTEPLARWVPALGEGRRLLQPDGIEGVAGALDLLLTRHPGGGWLFECLPGQGRDGFDPGHFNLSPPPMDADTLAERRRDLVREVAARSGFQRVMYYRFREDEDGDGEVLAEARQAEIYGSYLGLRFPASDIPRVARTLYVRNSWRLIPDARAAAVPVLGTGAPDLSLADLRSVSPVHGLYLANMGVRASLSLPIVAADQLRALVACHHSEPRRLPLPLLESLAQMTRGHALDVSAYESRRQMRLVDGLTHRFAAVRAMLERHGDAPSAWPELAPLLASEFAVDGAMLRMSRTTVGWGLNLEPGALEALDHWFTTQSREMVWQGDQLGRQVPDMPPSQVAGALVIRVVGRTGEVARVYLCRPEHIHEVAWGGNPHKPVERHDGSVGIAPRRSFEKWVEKRLGYSRAWDNETRLLAFRLRELLAGAAGYG